MNILYIQTSEYNKQDYGKDIDLLLCNLQLSINLLVQACLDEYVKALSSQSYGFSSSQVGMWELDPKES